MKNLVRSELKKILRTRTTWGLLAGAILLASLIAVSVLIGAGKHGAPPVGTTANLRRVLSASSVASLFAILAGIMGMAGEYRHKTISRTFIIMPRRSRVLAAKMAVFGLLGLVYGSVVLAAVTTIAWAGHSAQGASAWSLFNGELALFVIAAVLAAGLQGLLGVALGTLVKNQIAAVVVLIVWVQVVERLAQGLSPGVYRWLPAGAVAAFVRSEEPGLLPMWAGGLVALGYALLLALVASRTALRKDIA